MALLEPVGSLDELAPCELVIEAAPERADLKRDERKTATSERALRALDEWIAPALTR